MSKYINWLPALLGIGALTLAVSGESLWLDEFTSAWLAGQPGLKALAAGVAQTGSEAQMPLFDLFIWGWGRCFGTGEAALRCANIPWAVLGILSMRRFLRRIDCRHSALLFVFAPLLCYQMNEARPYIMLFGAAALALTSLDGLLAASTGGRPATSTQRLGLLLGIMLCAGASMLGFFLLPALAVYAVMFVCVPEIASDQPWTARALRVLRTNLAALVLAALLLLPFAVYYALTLKAGYGGQKVAYGLHNAAFSIYEWLGLAGLGPARHAIRALGPHAALRGHVYTLIGGLAAWTVAALYILVRLRPVLARPAVWRCGIALLCGTLVLTGAAIAGGASLWGRHYVFLMPFFIGLLGSMLCPAPCRTARPVVAWAGMLLAAMMLASSVRQRVVPIYRKAPWREATAVIRQLSTRRPDLPILLVCYDRALDYYGGPDSVIVAAGWTDEAVHNWTARAGAHYLVLHRPDKFDPSGAWQRHLSARPGGTMLWSCRGIRIHYVDNGGKPSD